MSSLRSMRSSNVDLQRGITLVELLVSTVVVAVLVGLAVPSLKSMLLNNRISAQMDRLFASMNYARNTALNNNVSVKVCPVSVAGSATCGANWSSGWIVVNVGNNALLESHPVAPNDPILSVVPIGGVSLSSVVFDQRGLTTTQGNFKTCDSRGSAYARSLTVLPTGFVQSGGIAGQAVWNASSIACP